MAKGLSNEDMSQFSDIVEIQGQSKSVTEKKISDGEEMTENINDRSETEFTLVEDPLNMHRTALNVTTLVSEIPNTINQENGITAPGQGKAFPCLVPTGKVKVGYNAPRDIPEEVLLGT